MTLFNRLCIIILGMMLAVCPERIFAAGDDDVNIVSSPSSTTAKTSTQKTASTDDSTVVHKSSHKKKKSTSSSDSSTASSSGSDKSTTAKTATASASGDNSAKKDTARKNSGKDTANSGSSGKSEKGSTQASAKTADDLSPNKQDKPNASTDKQPTVIADTKTKDAGKTAPATASTTKPATVSSSSASTAASSSTTSSKPNPAGLTVETGLPVAKHSGDNPADLPHVPAPYQTLPLAYQQMTSGSAPPLTGVVPNSNGQSSSSGLIPKSNFAFSNYPKRSRVYPWKTNIITTMFWIGEGSTSISSTDNHGSAWIEDWRTANRGTDTPYDRNGYAPANHAATVNPFYVALPFNDLAYPDKARRWLPTGWHRPDQEGKQVSACKDRWIEIKNAEGRICFAQWEDVGPLRSDHAEYVFGSERPTSAYTRAGLDVSPAVAQYLRIKETAVTSWRFVDDEDVPPGVWLKYEEEAVIYNAIHSQRRTGSSSLERASEPAEDDSAKRGAAEAKG